MVGDNDGFWVSNSLQNRYCPDSIKGATPSIAYHRDAFDGRIDAKNLIWIQAWVRAAQDDDTGSALMNGLSHSQEIW